MGTFASQIRCGRRTRSDPMMEERGGWISGETLRRDLEMLDVGIEVMVVHIL